MKTLVQEESGRKALERIDGGVKDVRIRTLQATNQNFHRGFLWLVHHLCGAQEVFARDNAARLGCSIKGRVVILFTSNALGRSLVDL